MLKLTLILFISIMNYANLDILSQIVVHFSAISVYILAIRVYF